MKAPPIPRDLLEYLQKVFPDRLPDSPMASAEEVAALVGNQQVIRHLKVQAEKQSLNVLRA